jgi:multiple sugar transport system permease protein
MRETLNMVGITKPAAQQELLNLRFANNKGKRIHNQFFWERALIYLMLILFSAAALAPLLWAVSSSLKTPEQIFLFPPRWIPNPIRWENYRMAWTMAPFGRFLLNTSFLTIVITLLQLATSCLAAYAFARLHFPGRDKLFLLYLGTMMIPGQVTIIPNFILMKFFGWVNSYKALIFPAVFNVFGTFLMRQYFLTLPYELEDAAKIDGCSRFQTFLRIILPLAKPAVAALTIFVFRNEWNSFLWPLIIINDTKRMPIQVGLAFFRGELHTEWEVLLAGANIALIPIILVFLACQKYFIKGVAVSGFGGR